MSKFNLGIPKANDLSDPYMFLPDNDTAGTEAFFRRLLDDKLPEPYYYLLKLLSRVEHDEVDLQEARDAVVQFENERRNKIEMELSELGYGVEDNKIKYNMVMKELLENQKVIESIIDLLKIVLK